MRGPSKFVEAPLNGDLKSANELLPSTDVNLTSGSSGWTALHYVVEDRVFDAAVWLLKNGADPNRKDHSGWTALHLAVDAEADSASQQHIADGTSPPEFRLTELLLKHGADPHVVTCDGKTSLSVATRYGYAELIDM